MIIRGAIAPLCRYAAFTLLASGLQEMAAPKFEFAADALPYRRQHDAPQASA